MNGKRIMRFVGNREKPEDSLYSPEEILHDWTEYPALESMKSISLSIEGLAGIKARHLLSDAPIIQKVEMPQSSYIDLFNSYNRISMGWDEPNIFGLVEPAEKKPKEFPDEDYEVNMMEALVGWRKWQLLDGKLASLYNHDSDDDTFWNPCEALEAVCQEKHRSPNEHCTCGIYASDDRAEAQEYEGVLGQVYGWGRYVRGSLGWRAQYAYPKSFYVQNPDPAIVETLRKYRVPVFALMPTRIYNPEEDGYEYGAAEADGDSGAYQESFAGEAGDSGEDDED